MKYGSLGFALLMLAGCGYVAKIDARMEYQRSLQEYRQCLRDTRSPAACEHLRAMVALNKQAFGVLAAGISPTGMGYYQFGEDD